MPQLLDLLGRHHHLLLPVCRVPRNVHRVRVHRFRFGKSKMMMIGVVAGIELGAKGFTLTASSPSVCADSYIGDNSKCEPSNDPWNVGTDACTGSEAYVGEPNSGLL